VSAQKKERNEKAKVLIRLTRHGALAEQQKTEKRFFSGNPPWWVKRIVAKFHF